MIHFNRRRHSRSIRRRHSCFAHSWACPFGSGYSFQVLAVSNRSGLSTAIPHAPALIPILFLFLFLKKSRKSRRNSKAKTHNRTIAFVPLCLSFLFYPFVFIFKLTASSSKNWKRNEQHYTAASRV